jgi:hypothetical protein
MSNLLIDFLAAGLIEKLDGDDERFSKIARAAEELSAAMLSNRSRLITATLAALDPKIQENDPEIIEATQFLLAQWKTMHSVYPSKPIGLLRAILLEACCIATQQNSTNAAIVWYTAADTLPLLRLGREEPIISKLLHSLARETEQAAFRAVGDNATKEYRGFSIAETKQIEIQESSKVDREDLLALIAATAGPNHPKAPNMTGGNPQWPHGNNGPWSHVFAEKMTEVFANELDFLAENTSASIADIAIQLQNRQDNFFNTVASAAADQARWLQEAIHRIEIAQAAQQTKLSTLWWYETLYSTSMCRSYRDVSPELASAIMPLDLLDSVDHPSPASVAYALAEAVRRLLIGNHTKDVSLQTLLIKIQQERSLIPAGWRQKFKTPPVNGRISIRDIVILALTDQELDLGSVIARAGLDPEAKFTLPRFAQSIFRQEQAVKLAENGK